jgi:glycine cleavage system H protein
MNYPDDLKYSKDHEWIRIEDNVATIGITAYAQEQLGDIVYVELPPEGEEFSKNDTFGVLESVKAVSDCYSPLSGTIQEVNNLLTDNPELVNEDCYGEGWIIRIELMDEKELEGLLDNDQYAEFVKEEVS